MKFGANPDPEMVKESVEAYERGDFVTTEEFLKEVDRGYAVGDVNSTEKGTTARSNGGKVQYNLIPFHLLAGVARVLTFGKVKYAPWNWAKGSDWSVSFDCLLRHLFKWFFCGEEIDEETGLHHLDHAMTNLLFLRHYSMHYPEGDDRPPSFTGFSEQVNFLNERYSPEKK